MQKEEQQAINAGSYVGRRPFSRLNGWRDVPGSIYKGGNCRNPPAVSLQELPYNGIG